MYGSEFLDKDHIGGQVTVELISFFGFEVNEVPHYVVRKRDDPDFFDFHVRSFETLWNRAKPLVPNEEAE